MSKPTPKDEALAISIRMFQFFSKEISQRAYEADELGRSDAWLGMDDCLYDGNMASWRDALSEAIGHEIT